MQYQYFLRTAEKFSFQKQKENETGNNGFSKRGKSVRISAENFNFEKHGEYAILSAKKIAFEKQRKDAGSSGSFGFWIMEKIF